MDYSKLTPEQLLELLKTQSPELYNALTTPVYDPYNRLGLYDNAKFPFYDPDPMSDLGFGEDLVNTIGRGYDPNLMVEDAHKYYPDSVLHHLRVTSDDLQLPREFPSDVYDIWSSVGSNILNNDTGEITSFPGYYNPDGTEPPAVASAELFNSLSDEDLLNLLPKDDSPLFDFNIYDLVDDYEGNAESVDRHLKRNKNFRWD